MYHRWAIGKACPLTCGLRANPPPHRTSARSTKEQKRESVMHPPFYFLLERVKSSLVLLRNVCSHYPYSRRVKGGVKFSLLEMLLALWAALIASAHCLSSCWLSGKSWKNKEEMVTTKCCLVSVCFPASHLNCTATHCRFHLCLMRWSCSPQSSLIKETRLWGVLKENWTRWPLKGCTN